MKGAAPTNLLWFRQDLRLADNPALRAAMADGARVLPVYVLDTDAAGRWAPGGAQRWWLHHSLDALEQALAQRGAALVLRRGPAENVLPALAKDVGAAAVYADRCAEPWARRQQQRVEKALAAQRVALKLLAGNFLLDIASVRSGSGGAFRVYTPFARACRAQGSPPLPEPAPRRIPAAGAASDSLETWHLLPTRPDWAGGLRQTWQPGEAGAARRLKHFLAHALADYDTARDRPDRDGTAMLSAHLHWGEISARTVWHAVQHSDVPLRARQAFSNELLWREFCAHLLWHQPHMPEQPLRPEFADMPWRRDARGLRAWQRGLTGIPVVDAGMRQLWQTGWMHNRVRMIVASFLTKHLLLRWQDGEAWFWDTLVDGDLPSNSANWQWVAGCGADAAPYFRVFNPVLQGRKFDPDGAYVRRYVPELAKLGARCIHAPWEAPAAALRDAGIELGHTYPAPLVDVAEGRVRALAAFHGLKHQPA